MTLIYGRSHRGSGLLFEGRWEGCVICLLTPAKRAVSTLAWLVGNHIAYPVDDCFDNPWAGILIWLKINTKLVPWLAHDSTQGHSKQTIN